MDLKIYSAIYVGFIMLLIITVGFLVTFYNTNFFTIPYMGISIVVGLGAGVLTTLGVLSN